MFFTFSAIPVVLFSNHFVHDLSVFSFFFFFLSSLAVFQGSITMFLILILISFPSIFAATAQAIITIHAFFSADLIVVIVFSVRILINKAGIKTRVNFEVLSLNPFLSFFLIFPFSTEEFIRMLE